MTETGLEQIQKDPSIQDMAKYNQIVKDQYAKLKKIPVGQIEKFSALVVNVPIGDLSYKDSKRVIYVLSDTLVKARNSFNKMVTDFDKSVKLINDRVDEIKKNETPVLSPLEELETIAKGIDNIIKSNAEEQA